MGDKKGFTLIELVLVIAILGVLAVVAMPNIFSVSLTTAQQNARDAVVANVQTGLSLYAASQLSQGNPESYPAALDTVANGTAASRATPLFTTVIKGGVTRSWTKKSGTCYTWTEGGGADDYAYNSTAGTFVYDADGC